MKPATDLKILIIRRDNIGDLVLTLPLFIALRERYPQAWIALYTNDYASEVVAQHPALDQIFVYRKLKHFKSGGLARIGEFCQTIWQRWQMRCLLRAKKLDWVLLATPEDSPRNLALARSFNPLKVAGFTSGNSRPDVAIALHALTNQPETVRVLQLLTAMDPALNFSETASVDHYRAQIFASAEEIVRLQQHYATLNHAPDNTRIAIHISARKPSQRWPVENFAVLIESLIQQYKAEIVLFWSPGSHAHPLHPGDDEKAQAIIQRLTETARAQILPLPTTSLRTLIAGLALCDTVICSDGGAMHIAAGLGKPIVCLFGKSDATRWHPWGVAYQLLQKPSLEVRDITVDEVVQAYQRLHPSLTHPVADK